MADQKTNELISILGLEYKGPTETLATGDEAFIQEVTRGFSDSVLASITYTPRPDRDKLH